MNGITAALLMPVCVCCHLLCVRRVQEGCQAQNPGEIDPVNFARLILRKVCTLRLSAIVIVPSQRGALAARVVYCGPALSHSQIG